jgi:hypothetical protein
MAPVVARARDKSGEAAPGVMPSPIAVLCGVEVQYLSSSFARVMCVLNFLNNVPHTLFRLPRQAIRPPFNRYGCALRSLR